MGHPGTHDREPTGDVILSPFILGPGEHTRCHTPRHAGRGVCREIPLDTQRK